MVKTAENEEIVASKVMLLHDELIAEWFGLTLLRQTRDSVKNTDIDAYNNLCKYVKVSAKSVIKKAAKIVSMLDLTLERLSRTKTKKLAEEYDNEVAETFINEQFVFEAFYTGDVIVDLKKVYKWAQDSDEEEKVKNPMSAILEAAATAEPR